MSELPEATLANPDLDPHRAPPRPVASVPVSASAADADHADDADAPDASHHGDPVHIAWRLLTSPRTFLALTVLLGAFFAWSATVPPRATPAELSRVMSFAEAELAGALGVSDPLTSPVFVLGLLLLGVVGAGMLLARRRDTGPFVFRTEVFVAAPIEVVRSRLPKGPRLGLRREGAIIAGLGVVALLIALTVARASGLEARIQLTPGDRAGERTSAKVLDGGIYVPRAFARSLRCGVPDPLDPTRGYACELSAATSATAEPLTLRAGEPASAGDLTFSLQRATPRFLGRDEAATFVMRRGDAPAEILELGGAPVALPTGERLQLFGGPDGPMVLVAGGPGHVPYLLVPATSLSAPAPPDAKAPLALAFAPPRDLTVRATSNPEQLLFFAGIGLLALGLFLFGVWPGVRLQLEPAATGTRVICWSTNDSDRAARVLDALRGSETP